MLTGFYDMDALGFRQNVLENPIEYDTLLSQ